MQNIFSVSEPKPELDPAFAVQQQAGNLPTAPSCNKYLPEHPPVGLRIGEALAQHTGSHVDWQATRIR